MPDRKLIAAENEELRRRCVEQARALRECEARYEAVFNSSMTFMCLCTAEGVVLDVSGPSLALGDVRIEDCVGKFIWEVPLYGGNPEEAAKVEAAVKGAARGTVHYESRILASNEWRVFDVVIRPVRTRLGGERRFIVLEGRDLTPTRSAEERARRAERMEALGLLTGGITHDFNNFLTVVIGALDMVVRGPKKANREALIEAALEAAQKAAALNSQLLAFARRAPVAAQDVDVGAALHSLQPLLKKAVGEAVEVKVRHAGDCLHVRMESAQFEAAILNLCVNARDAMPSGGDIEVEARPATAEELALAEVEATAVAITVRDTGVGIAPDVLPRVFDPFFTTKETGRGTGLGLSQVHGFARQTGGGVDVVSTPGAGSTFKLILPCVAGKDAASGAASEATPSLAIGSVLLVEDDETVASVTAAMMTELGMEVVSVANGPEAQRALETRSFDLLVTDLIMPGGLTGVELAQWARRRRPETKVLLFSGWTADARVAGTGDFAIIQKPFDMNALKLAIEQLA
ncbi:ATP-binding protein [Phenylobacterium sp. LjRoot225]|uniref:ATP-binding protein n=1 Tax=Phenylobacterium sp. LjRoot225 TaxID=3342285 RepID=UPI003ED1097D